jgi:hypothetical protein
MAAKDVKFSTDARDKFLRGVDRAVAAIIENINARSKSIAGNDEIAQVGTISANGDAQIGEIIARAVAKVGNDGVITVEEAKSLETELDVVEGLQFDRGYLSAYFVTNAEKMVVEHYTLHYSRLCNLRSGNSVGGTAKLRLLGIPYSWSSIHPGGPIALQET